MLVDLSQLDAGTWEITCFCEAGCDACFFLLFLAVWMAASSTSSEEESSAENLSTKTENEHWASLHLEFRAECGTTDLLLWRIQHSSGCKASWV